MIQSESIHIYFEENSLIQYAPITLILSSFITKLQRKYNIYIWLSLKKKKRFRLKETKCG